jgi:hypothetical protein
MRTRDGSHRSHTGASACCGDVLSSKGRCMRFTCVQGMHMGQAATDARQLLCVTVTARGGCCRHGRGRKLHACSATDAAVSLFCCACDCHAVPLPRRSCKGPKLDAIDMELPQTTFNCYTV